MLDPCEKGGSDGEEVSSKSMEGGDNQQKKTCADCGTSKTPLWRGGPAGPKSLCNACGIRSRKKKRDSLGLNRATGAGAANEKKLKKANHHNNNNNSSNHKLGDGLKQRLMALGREVMMRRSTADAEHKRRKLGEEEQAAVLLMALSYGSVYA